MRTQSVFCTLFMHVNGFKIKKKKMNKNEKKKQTNLNYIQYLYIKGKRIPETSSVQLKTILNVFSHSCIIC